MRRLFFVIFTLISINLIAEEKTAFFIPPKDWVIINPKTYTPYMKAAFTKNEKAICRPTMNFSIQETDFTLDEYTNEAKRAHEIDPNITYTILGNIDFKESKATLSEVSKTANSIDYKILQLILVKEKNAYILTAACKKEDRIDYYPIFINSFKSFELTDDLFSKISSASKKNTLLQKYNSLITNLKKSNDKQITKNLVSFEKYLDKNYQNEGKYFSMLVIEKALKEIKDLKK
ncbi:MAG: hypothetical protein K1060chlam1_00825 [Candidatus Anoxychlamydiales bacterium]|nr:hypothetical protein [Candidatus Anoxychlamydiales bacterium]